jgi:hypothetical protein
LGTAQRAAPFRQFAIRKLATASDLHSFSITPATPIEYGFSPTVLW